MANAVSLRIYERAQLADIGLGWTPLLATQPDCRYALARIAAAARWPLGVPLLVRAADLAPVPDQHFHWPSLLFVSLILLFGAVGEEMLFRGYAFQVLVRAIGPYATILPMAVLFGLAHSPNLEFHLAGAVEHVFMGRDFGICVPA